MNRENKRKQYEKGYYKTHPCTDSFTCKVCGRPVVRGRSRQRPPQPLPQLPVQPASGHRAGRPARPTAAASWTRWRVWVRKNGEWAIIHRCRRCGQLSSNRVAADDNPMKLMSIAMKPLTSPPFPLERIEEMTALMGGDGCLSRAPR